MIENVSNVWNIKMFRKGEIKTDSITGILRAHINVPSQLEPRVCTPRVWRRVRTVRKPRRGAVFVGFCDRVRT